MLEFLPLITSGLQLLGQGAALKNVAQGYQQTPAEIAQAQGMANQQRLLQALLNPNDPIYKNVVAGQNQQLQNATQSAISNFLEANRKNQLMGRTSYLNPERQDETINRIMMNATDANANTARSNALNQIITAANGYGQNASGYGGMVKNQQAAQSTNRAALPTTLGGAADILKQFQSGGGMSNIFGAMSGTAAPNGMMAWNGGYMT